jgi:hypothetical protein
VINRYRVHISYTASSLFCLEFSCQCSYHHLALDNKRLAERVGFEVALSDRYFAFNEMPKTEVFTDTYLLSHLEHESHKER